METKKDRLFIIQTRITKKELKNHKRELKKAMQKWVGEPRPLEKLVMFFWAVTNPIIWRLGKHSKWLRLKYYHFRKGKYLWGFMNAINDGAINQY